MKIQLPPISRRNKPKPILMQQPTNPPMLRSLVSLHITSLFAYKILDLPTRCIKRIADRHIHILMSMIFMPMPLAHRNLSARKRDINQNPIQLPLDPAPMRRIDHNSATRQPTRIPLQILSLLPDPPLDRI